MKAMHLFSEKDANTLKVLYVFSGFRGSRDSFIMNALDLS